MEKFSTGPIEVTWDPEARVALLRFASETRATGPDARALVEALTAWIGTDGRPFALLGDGGRLSGLDAEYRSVWAKFFREHRDDSYLAFFNMRQIVRIAAEMFRIGTGLRLRAFAREEEARAWLREVGIAA
ncbi:MAG: STAS/SEC14 domain-containing protein [Candidatus Limnocylindria bacterium]